MTPVQGLPFPKSPLRKLNEYLRPCATLQWQRYTTLQDSFVPLGIHAEIDTMLDRLKFETSAKDTYVKRGIDLVIWNFTLTIRNLLDISTEIGSEQRSNEAFLSPVFEPCYLCETINTSEVA